ncbi:ABC transporter substrate-binding protein [Anoxynatronum buryatiense]|uniref:Amino acid/amide ABC transporter substrate-binding protein, HAAT family n=1 Tax=Anoxynatronum buryatiense TaxID=489973 RepID=A0AA45WWJ2_9CLOT|nr:ABC transporter substrate-binding protein [Anoxynatronum buryatiense]SMP58058.1 amino acid/amide ABC transporter substrate-binding protein, HAAT family [Anoxynatronum buryatiense]
MNKRLIRLCTGIGLLAVLASGCQSTHTLEGQRKNWERNPQQPVTFAVAGRIPFLTTSTDFMKGAELAVEEINAAGGVAGRTLELEPHDDEGSVMKGTIIAQELAKNVNLSAVIGHTSTHVTIPVSTIYEEAGMVMISPIVSNSRLTQRGYANIFQNIPGDDDIGREMALSAHENGLERIVIYYADNEYGRGLANAFETAADDLNIQVVDRATRFHEDTHFRRALQKWQAMEYEAVFVADSMLTGKEFLFRLQEAGEFPAILADAGMDVDFIQTFGAYGEGAVLASLVNMEMGGERMNQFLEAFQQTHGEEPDEWAVQGYETIHILAEAVNRAQSPAPADVAEALRVITWEGLTGNIHFDSTGRVAGKHIYQKRVVNGRFVYELLDSE